MIVMFPTITLKGVIKFSIKKLIAGSEMASSTYIGSGEILLAPLLPGDITALRLDDFTSWSVGKETFIAVTQGVVKDYKAQGLSETMFSDEGLYVCKMSGRGDSLDLNLSAHQSQQCLMENRYLNRSAISHLNDVSDSHRWLFWSVDKGMFNKQKRKTLKIRCFIHSEDHGPSSKRDNFDNTMNHRFSCDKGLFSESSCQIFI